MPKLTNQSWKTIHPLVGGTSNGSKASSYWHLTTPEMTCHMSLMQLVSITLIYFHFWAELHFIHSYQLYIWNRIFSVHSEGHNPISKQSIHFSNLTIYFRFPRACVCASIQFMQLGPQTDKTSQNQKSELSNYRK